ncbi:MAG: AAA family ATPase [Nannocystis sp.]|nr:ATP-binding protein [Nannocystis sp.]MBA3545583.1 AAA family ATPase [Nannocystis sp.]
MLTRLEVDGFKSLRDFSIELEPLTVLLGPNDAGKSNILEALALSSRLAVRSPEDALKQGRGRALDQFRREGSQIASAIALNLETLEPDEDDDDRRWVVRMRQELRIERMARGTASERVDLRTKRHEIARAGDGWLSAHAVWDPLVLDVLDVPGGADHGDCAPLTPYVELYGLHLPDASECREPGQLAADASDLPSVLAWQPDIVLAEIRAQLAALIPGIADFAIIEQEEQYHLEFRARDGATVPARLASHGTLRMLALLTAVLARRSCIWDSIICMEEPEDGIDPGRLRRLIDLLRDVTRPDPWIAGEAGRPAPQILITTHSPVFLAALRQQPDALRYINTVVRDGQRLTWARRVGEPSRAERSTTIGIGEIDAILHSEDIP